VSNTPLATGLVQYVALLFALVFHEASHAASAYWLGDDTAKGLGRMSLNPMAHIDIIGTVIFPLAMIFFPSFILIGWAKPVPINPMRFNKTVSLRTGELIVSIAGPLSNILLGTICLIIYHIVIYFNIMPQWLSPLFFLLIYSIQINFVLAFFNLLPIPPLDGSGVLYGLTGIIKSESFNSAVTKYMNFMRPYGFFVLYGLLLTGVLSYLLIPVIMFLRFVM